MNSDPLILTNEDHDKYEYRICQACGQPARLKTYDSGAPTTEEGHRTQNCEYLDDFVYSFEPSAFGIVVPQKDSDVIWEFQTDGLMCSHPTIRGTYIPFSSVTIPSEDIDYNKVSSEPTDSYWEDVLRLLVSTNYANNTGSNYNTDYIWDLVNRELPFIYELVDFPDGYRESHEAWKWIKITGENSDVDKSFKNFKPLVGERVLLVYPNSD